MLFSFIYFFKDVLPKSFDTPIFWGEDDLAELEGTCVVGWFLLFSSTSHPHSLSSSWSLHIIKFAPEKLGKDQAEKDYGEKILPAVQVRHFVNQNSRANIYYFI
jgi:SET domain-containing protein 6